MGEAYPEFRKGAISTLIAYESVAKFEVFERVAIKS